MIDRQPGVPLFVDTNALVAYFAENDERHDEATTVFESIGGGDLPYGPLYTSRYVLAETATTLLVGFDHDAAVSALDSVRDSSSFNLLPVDADLFGETFRQFQQYDDQRISFVDHMNAVLAGEYDIDHVFAFDDDFATLGMVRVPVDTDDV